MAILINKLWHKFTQSLCNDNNCLCSGCYSEIAQTGLSYNQRGWFHIAWTSESKVSVWLDSGDMGVLLFLSMELIPLMKGSNLMICQRPYLLHVTWGVRIKTQVWRNAKPRPLHQLAPQSGEGQRSVLHQTLFGFWPSHLVVVYCWICNLALLVLMG